MNETEFEQDLETVLEMMKNFLANKLRPNEVRCRVVLATLNLHLEAKKLKKCSDENHRKEMTLEFGRDKQVLEKFLTQQTQN